ncbi:MAG: hypothetical protein IK997_03220 [Bacilli bacterium]|nr:hypothetical protein [Bacilli bacterium]
MGLEEGRIIEFDGMNLCILNVQKINDLDYIYVAEMVDDDITGNFYVYKIENDNIEKVINSDELKDILPIFIKSMSSD